MNKFRGFLARTDINLAQKSFTTLTRFLSYKSDLSLETLYPGKKQNLFTPPVSLIYNFLSSITSLRQL